MSPQCLSCNITVTVGVIITVTITTVIILTNTTTTIIITLIMVICDLPNVRNKLERQDPRMYPVCVSLFKLHILALLQSPSPSLCPSVPSQVYN